MTTSFSCGCSLRVCGSIVVVLLAIFVASLPTLMSGLLQYMFTAPNQMPWPHGSLRLINVSGIPTQALNSKERIELLGNGSDLSLKHRPESDVWIVSYVKSGTTWTIGLYAALLQHPSAEFCGNIQKTTREFCPQPEMPDLGWGDDGFGHSMETLNAWPSPRCFKSHWQNQNFAEEIPSKIVYVMRNAQDQMISHWNQVWGMGFHYGTTDRGFQEGWPGFVDDWLDGNVENGPWFDHVAGWYSRHLKDPEHVLILRYEDLKANTQHSVTRLAQFVGLPEPNVAQMDRIVHQTSFDTMRKADEQDVGLQFMRWLGVLRKHHIRQGGESDRGDDDDRLTLTKLQRERMERKYETKLKPLGMPKSWVFLD